MWAFLHAISLVGGGAEGVPYPASIAGSLAIVPVIFAAVLIIMRVELWRRSELIFMANLGCSFGRVASFITLECVALETALRVTLG